MVDVQLGSKYTFDVHGHSLHCVKYQNFNKSPYVKILWKCTGIVEFRAIHPKLCANCAFPQNFNTRKLGEILVV